MTLRLPYLQTGDGEVGDEADDLGVVLHLDQLAQLVVTLEPRQQTAELVVVVGVRQTLGAQGGERVQGSSGLPSYQGCQGNRVVRVPGLWVVRVSRLSGLSGIIGAWTTILKIIRDDTAINVI